MILVTGGFGYLGGRIVASLVNSGLKVRVATRKKESLSVRDKNPLYEVVEIDLMSVESLSSACAGVSHIIHLAALNAVESNLDYRHALMVNGVGVLNLLKAAKVNQVSNFVYFSTVHVYGNSLKGDEYTLPAPINSYAITSRLAEDYVLEAHIKGDISSVVFRLSNVVGPPIEKEANCWDLVANNLCRQVVSQGVLSLKTSQSIERDFIPISVISNLMLHTIKQDLFKGKIFNISSNNTLTLENLANLIVSRCEKILKIQPLVDFADSSSLSLSEGEPKFYISNKKITNTGFLIKSDLSDDIDQLLRSCKEWFGQAEK